MGKKRTKSQKPIRFGITKKRYKDIANLIIFTIYIAFGILLGLALF